MKSFGFLFALICLSGPLCAKDLPGDIPGKAQDIKSPGDVVKNNQPPAETPSGTKPAEPANPGENPAKPAEPGDKEKPDTGKDAADKNKPDNADKNAQDNKEVKDKPDNGENGKPEDSDKDKDSKDAKDKKDKTDKDSTDKKDNPGKGGKSGGGQGAPALPAGVSAPQGGGASILPAAGGIVGGILSGGKKEAAKEKKKEAPKPELKEAAISSDTIKSTTTVQASTTAAAAEPLFSEGKGPKIAVLDFEGESGAEFADLLAEALKTDLKVYNRKKLADKNYGAKTAGVPLAKKAAAELAVDYVITGKINKKTETLSIVSVFLRSGKTGEIKMTDYSRLKSAEDLKPAAENTAQKIKGAIK